MKKIKFFAGSVLLLLVCAQIPWSALAKEGPPAKPQPYISALRSLSINRSLLEKSQAEYQALLEEERRQGPTRITTELLAGLRYKIQALKEDAQRLRALLPMRAQADEFLKDMVQRQKDRAQRNYIEPEEEKKLRETVRRTYQLHEKALSSMAQGRADEAEKTYQEIVLLTPDDDEAYLLLGHTCLATGHYRKAGEAFLNAIHINPLNAQEIPRLYENILVENPSDDEAMAQLGFAKLLLGDRVAAKDSFETALEINPRNSTAANGLLELQPR